MTPDYDAALHEEMPTLVAEAFAQKFGVHAIGHARLCSAEAGLTSREDWQRVVRLLEARPAAI